MHGMAMHSSLGNVKQQLLFDDGVGVDLAPNETLDLKFPALEKPVTYFILEIDSYNVKALM